MALISKVPKEHRDTAERLKEADPDLFKRISQAELNHRVKVVARHEGSAARMGAEPGNAVRAYAGKILRAAPILEHKAELARLRAAAYGTPKMPAEPSADVRGAYSAKITRLKEERSYDHDLETAVDRELNRGKSPDSIDLDALLGYSEEPSGPVSKAKRLPSYEPGLLATDYGKDGWCVWCGQPITVDEGNGAHAKGACIGAPEVSREEVGKAVQRAMGDLRQKENRLRKEIDRQRAAIASFRIDVKIDPEGNGR